MPELISARALIRDQFGRFLMVERPEGGEQAGLLQSPGGKVEATDGDPRLEPLWLRLTNAVEREVPEETGLEVCALGKPRLVSAYVIQEGKYAGRLCSSYFVECAIVGSTEATEPHPTSWWAGEVILRDGAEHFAPVTRLAVAAHAQTPAAAPATTLAA